MTNKHQGPLQRGKSIGSSLSGPSHRRGSGLNLKRQLTSLPKSSHNIVVVKPAIKAETTDKDPDLLKLQVICISFYHISFYGIIQTVFCRCK